MNFAYMFIFLCVIAAADKWFYKWDGCTGPGVNDCVGCIRNAVQSPNGSCECAEGYTGALCLSYAGICASLCEICVGPGVFECIQWFPHADHSYTGECECQSGWYGPTCNLEVQSQRPQYPKETQQTRCSPMCLDGCKGPKANDWLQCIMNSHRDRNGYWICDQYYFGDACQFFNDQSSRTECHPICYGGCSGSTALDCIDWVPNAHRDSFGYCVCNPNFLGEKCEKFFPDRYSGECHPRCEQPCDGPEAKDCAMWVKNASKNQYGYWTWEDGFFANDCSFSNHYQNTTAEYQWKAICVNGCNGPTSKDCINCVPNAHRDVYGYWVCNQDYGADDCALFIGYQGECDPKCRDGCNGPSPRDCASCRENAYLVDGECKCQEHWHGPGCQEWQYVGVCDPKCNECVGETAADCLSCVVNAVWSINGCECDTHWEGPDCSFLKYKGACDPKCDGCIGPKANECIKCVDNAETNKFGYCLCKPFWSGNDCSIYEKECNPMCKTCRGPWPSDCLECIENSHYDENKICRCDQNWAGQACAYYVGTCSGLCDSCTGPTPTECRFCIENTEFESEGTCTCTNEWSGELCDRYIGVCDSICKDCSGPGIYNCNSCIDNAYPTLQGYCECNYYWNGPSCNVWNGPCSLLCSNCLGPHSMDCVICIEHAHFHMAKECQCDLDWQGAQCQEYTGTCHSLCQGGWIGPEDVSCQKCVAHSYRDTNGVCVCSENWRGPDCQLWGGICDQRCHGCNGPTSFECGNCKINAHLENDEWVCDTLWDGADCSLWSGKCDQRCQGCFGPTNSDCVRWVSNAYYDYNGHCKCEEDWGGDQCGTYLGGCDHRCQKCQGPSSADCLACVPHAFRNEEGQCECLVDWSGEGCDLYSGNCDKLCLSCSGPTQAECVTCVNHSTHYPIGCVCDEYWDSFEDCSEWSGPCSENCLECIGQQPSDCIKCKHHASRVSGICQCEDLWTGDESCEVYVGPCSPVCEQCYGPSAHDCYECTTNSHRDDSGKCVCLEHWGGVSCQMYTGICNPICVGCSGPGSGRCISCAQRSFESVQGQCVCEDGWLGENCQNWGFECNPRCKICHGPEDTDCIQCIENAIRSDNGSCICLEGWKGETCNSEVYDCHKSCAECHGKKQNDWDSCFDGFTLVDGYCLPCHENCTTCNGLSSSDCLTCPETRSITFSNECICCSLSCTSCTAKDVCTSCRSDSELIGYSCVCKDGKVRNPVTQHCDFNCPTGRSGSDCEHTDGPVHIDFTDSTQWEILKNCRPPVHIENRGAYFNGINYSAILNPFNLDASFTFKLWLRLAGTDASIISFNQLFVDKTSMYSDYEASCSVHAYEYLTENIFDLWLSPCFSFVLDIGDFRVKTDEGSYSRDKWAELMLIAEPVNPSGRHLLQTKYRFTINGFSHGSGVLDDMMLYETLFNQIHLGSYMSKAYVSEGLFHSFSYYNGLVPHFSNAQEWKSGHYTDGNFTTSTHCAWNQFYDEGCQDCHPSCIYGWDSEKFCVECDESCKTCDGLDEDQCISCWCGASETDGLCECDEGFTGTAENCQESCPANCQMCFHGMCLLCSDGYELQEDYTPGICEPCDKEEIDLEGYLMCRSRSIRKPAGSCSCQTGEWYDGTYCRVCPNNCAICEPINEIDWEAGFECTACKEGYRFGKNSDLCQDFCATGFKEEAQRCIGPSGIVADFIFNTPKDTWRSGHAWPDIKHQWTVQLLEPHEPEYSLPYIIDDRGLWFDGKTNLAQFQGFTLHHTFTLDTWAKPHANGCFLSISNVSVKGSYLSWCIEDTKMVFHNTKAGQRYSTDENGINQFYWMHAAITVEWNNHVHKSTLTFWRDNNTIDQVTFDLMVKGLSEKPNHFHTLAARMDADSTKDFYRGFVLTFRILNEALGSFTDIIQADNCLSDVSCLIWPSISGECPGFCNWNHFWNGNRCQRCPMFCRSGCQKSGTCETS